jgi:hypothetical protein
MVVAADRMNMDEQPQQDRGGRSDGVVVALIGLAGIIAGALINAEFDFLSKGRELSVRLVEIGIGILQTDPSKGNIAPARQWAITVIENNSGVRFTPGDRDELLKKPLSISPYWKQTVVTPMDIQKFFEEAGKPSTTPAK